MLREPGCPGARVIDDRASPGVPSGIRGDTAFRSEGSNPVPTANEGWNHHDQGGEPSQIPPIEAKSASPLDLGILDNL
jgi:hypothetical protein